MITDSHKRHPLLTKGSIIIGLDPGSRITGYAVLESLRDDPRAMHDFKAQDYGIFKASRDLSFTARIGHMFEQTTQLLKHHPPGHCVIEDAYVRGLPRSSLKLAQVRGGLIAAALACYSEVHEMTASHAKKTITGGGAADKQQVAAILIQSFLRRSSGRKNIPFSPAPSPTKPPTTTSLTSSASQTSPLQTQRPIEQLPEDASDALALALAWGLESSLRSLIDQPMNSVTPREASYGLPSSLPHKRS